MSGYDWERKRGDRHPPIEHALTGVSVDTAGTETEGPVDLTGVTAAIITLRGIDAETTTGAPTAAVTLVETVVVDDDPTSGIVHYELTASFAGLPAGTYRCEYEIRYPDGTRETFPDADGRYFMGRIWPDLADAP